MASMMKKAMIYLGLGPDEEYEQYDEPGLATDSPRPARQPAHTPRREAHTPAVEERPLIRPQQQPSGLTGTVRPIAMEPEIQTTPEPATAPAAVTPTPEPRPSAPVQPVAPSTGSAVRTLGPASAMPHAVSPTSFNDAQELGDRFKAGQPVIVNLQAVDRDLRRRLVDFASGLCYAMAGKMKRVADQVYLLTPPDVDVTADEARRHLD